MSSSREIWFYIDASNESIGPFTADKIKALVRQRVITRKTLVTRAGFADWLPYPHAAPFLYFSFLKPSTKAQSSKEADVWVFYAVLTITWFLFPIGLFALWFRNAIPRKQKIAATAVGLVWYLLIGIAAVYPDSKSHPPIGDEASSQPTAQDNAAQREKQIRGLLGRAFSNCVNPEKVEVNQVEYTSKYNVEIRYYSTGDQQKDEQQMANSLRKLFKSDLPFQEIWFWAYGNVSDDSGNSSEDVVYKISINNDVAGKVNWDGVSNAQICRIWETHWIDTSFYQSK